MKSRVLPLLLGGFLALFTFQAFAQPQPGVVSTVAGLANFGCADGIGSAAKFLLPTGVALDSSSNLYVADGDNFTIRKITPDGLVTTIAGQAQVYGTNDGTGTNALFGYPYGVAVDQGGNVFVADTDNDTIRKIATNGVVTTLAGQPTSPGAMNGSISVATFDQPYGIAIDQSNNIYVADHGNSLIRKISSGSVTNIGTSANPAFSTPCSVAADSSGNVYVDDYGNDLIRRIAPGGAVTTIGSSVIFDYPLGIAVDGATNVYVADTYNEIIRVISGNNVFTLAGNEGIAGDGDGISPQASFNSPWGVTVDAAGNVYVGDSGNGNIRKITSSGVVSTLAGPDESYGTGADGPVDGPSGQARFYRPTGVAVDGATNIYVADSLNNCIRLVTPSGNVTTLAGSITGDSGSADGTNTGAAFNDPTGLCLDAATNIYVADLNNSTIRKIMPDALHSNWVTTTIAGTAGINNYTNGIGTNAWLHNPYAVAVDGATNIYVTDVGNGVVRKIAPNGNVTLYAGMPGVEGASNSVNNTLAQFSEPLGIAVDGSTNVYVADYGNNTVRLILPAGGVTNVNSFNGYNGPEGVAVDQGGNIYVANSSTNTILEIDSETKSTTTIAGAAGYGIALTGSADGFGPAAEFDDPVGIAVDSSSNIYLADQLNNTIRKGTVYNAGTTVFLTLKSSPSGLALEANGMSYSLTPQVLTLAAGGSITNTALLNPGYVFTNWTTNGVAASISSNCIITVNTNLTVVANYLPGYTLAASASPSYAGTVSGEQTFLAGTTPSVTVMAFTNGGYVFTGWTTNGNATVASTSANYTFTITNNLSLVANFAISAPQQIQVFQGANVITNNQTNPAVSFGSVQYGSNGPTIAFTVTNSGSQTLTLLTPGAPVGYTLTGAPPATLAAGTSGIFSVKLNATSASAFSGNVVITNNDSNHDPFTFAITGTVIPAPLLITAQSQSITVGATAPTTTVTYSGFVNGDTPASLSTLPNIFSILSGVQPVGVYVSNYTASGAVDPNYSISYAAGALFVNSMGPEIQVFNGVNVITNNQTNPPVSFGSNVLSSTAPTLVFTVTNAGGQTLTLNTPTVPMGYILTTNLANTLSNGSATTFSVQLNTASLGAFSGDIVITNNDTNNSPFTFAVTGAVAPAPLLITVQSQTSTYGSNVPATTVSYSGFINGDTSNSLAIKPAISSALSGGVAAGTYVSNYTASGAVDSNYMISYAAGNLIVNPAPLLISAQPQMTTYGSVAPTTTVIYNGFVNGETNTALTTLPAILSAQSGVTPAGTYVGNYTASGAVDENYSITYAAGNLTVNPLAAFLTGTRRFDGTAIASNSILAVSNAVLGDTVNVASGSGTIASTNVGTNNIISFGSLALGGGKAGNYTLTNATGAVIVTPTPLIIAAQSQTTTYGSNVPATTVTYTGFVGGETNTSLATQPAVASARSNVVAAGTYASNYTASGAVDADYSITYTSGTLTVGKAPLLITAQPQTITYGDSAPATTVTYSNFVNDDTAASLTTGPAISSAHTGIVAVGIYPGNYTASGAVDPNYSISYAAGALTVNAGGVVNGALISLSGDLAFGVVATNASAQAAFKISNGGNVPLIISNIAFPAGFGATWTNTIAAGGAQTVTVTFLPTAPIYYHGVATVVSDAITNSASLPISGFGANVDATLTILTNGYGKVTPNEARALKVGNHYTLTATAASGNLFSNWSGSITTNKNPLGFPMRDSMVLQANFVTNPFLPLLGAYNGLFAATNGVTEDTAGMLKNLTINQKGAYSGSLLIAGASHAMSGSFSLDEQATNVIKRSQGNLVVTMTLATNEAAPQITGFVTGTNGEVPWQAPLLADHATNIVPSSAYTMLIPPQTNNPATLPPNGSPGGDGYALINNVSTPAKSAKATISGALADGTAFSQTAPVSQDGFMPVYTALYSGKGLLLGWINMAPTNTNFGIASLTWVHPQRSTGSYRNGFTNLVGANSSLLSAWTNSPFGDAVFRSLTNLSVLATIDDGNVITNVEVAVSESGQISGVNVTGSIKPKTGLLTISVGKGASKVTGYGAILLNTNLGGGYYLTKSNTAQAVKLSP